MGIVQKKLFIPCHLLVGCADCVWVWSEVWTVTNSLHHLAQHDVCAGVQTRHIGSGQTSGKDIVKTARNNHQPQLKLAFFAYLLFE